MKTWFGFVAPLLGAAFALGTYLAPMEAQACGGLFCDAGPPSQPQPVPMPVDQTGEDILFITTAETVEVHIRIQYEGDAQQFAWVVPVQSVPTEFAVGSDAFFDAIKTATVPTYGYTTENDACLDETEAEPDPFMTAGPSSGGVTMTGGFTGGGPPPGEVVVFAEERVGAYEVAVLGEGTAAQVLQWLDDNGYQQNPEAEPILQEYLDEGHVFAAIKLQGGADVDEIHPVVFEFAHSEPCVPLRLTRIAAKDDMEVRAYFLGDARVVPRNYRHVLVNPLMIDWSRQGSNYKSVIGGAVDAQMANGRAFVTEYAGPSRRVDLFPGVIRNEWNADVFVGIDVAEVIDELTRQRLYQCDTEWGRGCGALHPLLDALLREHLPVPDSLLLDDFYANLADHVELIDLDAWGDGTGFADKLRERVVGPGEKAVELIENNPYLTRMYTVISPHEMLEDPMFHENSKLGDVPRLRNATERVLCSGDSVWTLPGGREVYVPALQSWPVIEGNPWEAQIQETPAAGSEVVLVDNNELIDELLLAYNAGYDWPEGAGAEDGGSGGCGCRANTAWPGLLWVGAFWLGLGWLRRRR